jgi:hypothetical protein
VFASEADIDFEVDDAMALGSHKNRRVIVWLAESLVDVFTCLQLARPQLTNPPVSAEIQAPADVKQILMRDQFVHLLPSLIGAKYQ